MLINGHMRSQVPAKRPAKEAPVASSSKSKLSSQVERDVKSESEEEDEDNERVARRKRPSLGRGVKGSRNRIVDSEDGEGA